MNTYLKWSLDILLLAVYLDWIDEFVLHFFPTTGLILIHSHHHVVTRTWLIDVFLELHCSRFTNPLWLSKNGRRLPVYIMRWILLIWMWIIWVYCCGSKLVFYDLCSFLLPLLCILLGLRVSWYVWACTLSNAYTHCCHLMLCTLYG